jgi:hypothetical protein
MVNSPREIQPLAGKDKQPRPSGETMVKYCIHCGKANDDQAVFCIACGQRFPDQTPPPSVLQAVPAPAPSSQATNVFTAEIGPGAHEHMLTDVYLKDSTGKVLLVARKKSLLHAEYTVVDGDEGVIGFIEQKTHLTHRTVSIEDTNHNVQGSVQISNIEKNRAPPSCWLEDPSGNRLGSIVFSAGLMGFEGVRPDGTAIFEASFPTGQGMMQGLRELGRRAYAIRLLDSGFPLNMLLTIIVALDQT